MGHLPRMCANDDSDGVTGDGHRIGHDDVQGRPASELDQLFRLTQSGGGAGGKNQYVWGSGHVTGH